MQKRSRERWLGVLCTIASVGLMVQLASPSSAWAAPKKKKGKHAPAAASVEPEEPASPSSSSSDDRNVDDMMEDSAKNKSVRQQRADEEAADRASSRAKTSKEVGEPDAWERPPAEEEKPKKSKITAEPEVKKGDDRKWAIEINAGYGFETSKYFSGDPYGLGAGLHGTYEFESHLVVGLGGMWFLGSSGTSTSAIGGAGPGQLMPYEVNYWLGYAEVGYSFWFGDNSIILRPSLWVGLAWGVSDPPMVSGSSGVITSLLLGPGLTLDFLLGSNGWYLGADVRILVMTGDGASGLPLLAKFGKRF